MSNFIKQHRIIQLLLLGAVVIGLFVDFKNNNNNVVNIYGWYGIFPHKVIKDFERETGIKVVYDSFDNNNILEAKLLSGSSGYDVVFPSFIPYASRETLLKVFSKIDYQLIPNAINTNGALTQKFINSGGKIEYVLPIFWGTMGIIYNANIMNREFPNQQNITYNELFNPDFMQKISKYGISLPEEYIDLFPQAKAYLLNHNTELQKNIDIKKYNSLKDDIVVPLLASIRKYVTKFNSTTIMFDLLAEEVCLAICSSDQAFKIINSARSIGKYMKYSITKNMTPAWIDCVAIPKNAPHKANAHKFIDFILRPKIALEITNYSGILINIPSNYPLIDDDMLAIPNIIPSIEEIDSFILGAPITSEDDMKRERHATTSWSKIKVGAFA